VIEIRKDSKIGVICRGGPVNGPYSAAVLRTLKEGLAAHGLKIANLYGNSAAVPSAVLSAIGEDGVGCDIWANLHPHDLIIPQNGWSGRMRTIWRMLSSEAIFDDSPLEDLIKRVTPTRRVFADDALPVKLMAVDYLTGFPVTASNKNPKHRWNWHALELGSMALVPFLKPQIIYDVVADELLADPYIRSGPLRDIAVLMDGGYADNLMFDAACRDTNSVVFVVDINGMQLGPLDTYRWDFWPNTLQRAFHVLVTTNDERRYHGVQRTNAVLHVRDELLRAVEELPPFNQVKLRILIEELEQRLELGRKHKVTIIPIQDRKCSRSFDFATFTPHETMHLLHCGEEAAQRVIDTIQVMS